MAKSSDFVLTNDWIGSKKISVGYVAESGIGGAKYGPAPKQQFKVDDPHATSSSKSTKSSTSSTSAAKSTISNTPAKTTTTKTKPSPKGTKEDPVQLLDDSITDDPVYNNQWKNWMKNNSVKTFLKQFIPKQSVLNKMTHFDGNEKASKMNPTKFLKLFMDSVFGAFAAEAKFQKALVSYLSLTVNLI